MTNICIMCRSNIRTNDKYCEACIETYDGLPKQTDNNFSDEAVFCCNKCDKDFDFADVCYVDDLSYCESCAVKVIYKKANNKQKRKIIANLI